MVNDNERESQRRYWPVTKPVEDAPITLRCFPVWVTLLSEDGKDEATSTLRLNVHARSASEAIAAVRQALDAK